jgi:hypothetical protein
MTYELLTSISMVVEDIPSAVSTLVDAIGIGVPKPHWYVEGSGIRAQFCRVHPSYVVAPTLIELVTAAEVPPDASHAFPVAEIAAKQGNRPVKIHATGIGLPAVALYDLGRHLQQLGVSHWYLGAGDTARLVISHDLAGLFVEAIPSAELRLGDEGFHGLADVPAGITPEAMVRIAARRHLVADLEETLRVLDRTMRWKHARIVDEPGCRRAIMALSAPRSAQLELVQPTGPGRVQDAYDELGPGAWTIQIAVADVAAKAEDLARRRTPYTAESDVLRVDPAATLGVPFEFVAAGQTSVGGAPRPADGR